MEENKDLRLFYKEQNLENISKNNPGIYTIKYSDFDRVRRVFNMTKIDGHFSFGFSDIESRYGVVADKVDWADNLYRCIFVPESKKAFTKICYITADGSVIYNMIDLVLEADARSGFQLIKNNEGVLAEIKLLPPHLQKFNDNLFSTYLYAKNHYPQTKTIVRPKIDIEEDAFLGDIIKVAKTIQDKDTDSFTTGVASATDTSDPNPVG